MNKLLMISVVCGLLTACRKGEMKEGQVFKTSDIEVEVINIGDSRCPTGAVCVWQGGIQADLRISDDESAFDFRLGTNSGQNIDTVLLGHEVRLIDVFPFPVLDKNPKKKVKLEIIKL